MSQEKHSESGQHQAHAQAEQKQRQSGYSASSTVGCSGAPVKIITIISATKLNTQFTSAKHTFSSGKMYLGIYTF